MALDRPVHAPETADGRTAPAFAAPAWPGAAAHGGLGQPPARSTNLQASAEHDEVTLIWSASTDQTVTHHTVLRRNRDADAIGLFHVIESNAGPETSYDDSSASSRYNYRMKTVIPTSASRRPGYVKAHTPAAPDPAPAPTPTPEPGSTADDQVSINLTAAPAEGGGVALRCTRSEDGPMTLEIDSQERNAHPAPAPTPWNRAITRRSSKQRSRN